MYRFAVAIFVAALLPVVTAHAEANVTYLSTAGTDNDRCTAAQPCQTFSQGLFIADAQQGARLMCLNPVSNEDNIKITASFYVADLDCPGGTWEVNQAAGLEFDGSNVTVKVRHMTFIPDIFGVNAMTIGGSGTLLLEDCVFQGFASSAALDIEPNGSLSLLIKNSRMSNNGSGILLKPKAGGSIHATLDHVAIANNSGGGIRIDTTNGPVTLDITDGVVSDNGGNGVNAIGGPSAQNIVSIKSSIFAKNGAAGVQANGVNAGVLVATTLFDQNAAGALSVVNGGNLFTYGNNNIVGARGSAFTGTAALQ
jgi:hypothetical protein